MSDTAPGRPCYAAGPAAAIGRLKRTREPRYEPNCPPAVSGQGSHDHTFPVACALVHGFHLSDADALALLAEWNQTCLPPWSDKELLHKVADARSKGSYPDMLANNHHAPAKKPPAQKPRATLRPFSTIEKRPVSWLWPLWVPLGKVTILDGDPGLGKSTLLLDLAARVSTNGVMPDASFGATGSVVIMSAEDAPEDTILPRLELAGADLSKVHFLDDMTDVLGDPRPPEVPGDLKEIEACVKR